MTRRVSDGILTVEEPKRQQHLNQHHQQHPGQVEKDPKESIERNRLERADLDFCYPSRTSETARTRALPGLAVAVG